MTPHQWIFWSTLYGTFSVFIGALFTVDALTQEIKNAKPPISRARAAEILKNSFRDGIAVMILWPLLLAVGTVLAVTYVPAKIIAAWWHACVDGVLMKVNGPPDLRESVHAREIPGHVDRHRST